MPKVQGGLPVVWRDAMSCYGPERMSTATLSTAMSGQSTFCGTAPNELVVHTLSTTGARWFGIIQLDHDQFIGSTVAGSGSTQMSLSPHVHWTCSTSPSTATICEFKLNYVISKLEQTPTSNVSYRFGSTVATSTGRTTMPVSTTTPDWAFKHFVTDVQDITLKSSLCGPSMMIIYNLQLGAAHNLAQTVYPLSVDVHYQRGPSGTDTEYS